MIGCKRVKLVFIYFLQKKQEWQKSGNKNEGINNTILKIYPKKVRMLTKIKDLKEEKLKTINEVIPVLQIGKQSYQNYLAFLSQTCEEMTSDNHVIYLVKMAFDDVLDLFTDEDLLVLQEKQDMYLNYIIHSTFKNCHLVQQDQFQQNIQALTNFYQPTEDEILLLDRIQITIKNSPTQLISPFSYIETYKKVFSQKVHIKLQNMLKFVIGDSLCYKMPSEQIFGMCLKWTIDRYKIKNVSIDALIGQLIELNNPSIEEKLSQLTLLMNQVMNMSSQ